MAAGIAIALVLALFVGLFVAEEHVRRRPLELDDPQMVREQVPEPVVKPRWYRPVVIGGAVVFVTLSLLSLTDASSPLRWIAMGVLLVTQGIRFRYFPRRPKKASSLRRGDSD
jgi:hypothetical protein